MGQESKLREKYPLVVSRAVAKMPVLLELALPFVALGGYFIAYKGPEGATELQEAENALQELGGSLHKLWHYDLPQQFGKRSLIVIKKNMSRRKIPQKSRCAGKDRFKDF